MIEQPWISYTELLRIILTILTGVAVALLIIGCIMIILTLTDAVLEYRDMVRRKRKKAHKRPKPPEGGSRVK